MCSFNEALHNKPRDPLHFPYFRYHNCYLFSWCIYSASCAQVIFPACNGRLNFIVFLITSIYTSRIFVKM